MKCNAGSPALFQNPRFHTARVYDRLFRLVLVQDCKACRVDRASIRNVALWEELGMTSIQTAAAVRAFTWPCSSGKYQ